MKQQYSKKQLDNVQAKFTPQADRTYLVTDQCFWKKNAPENYNIFDPARKPHTIQLVDIASGTVVNLPSGSIVKVVPN